MQAKLSPRETIMTLPYSHGTLAAALGLVIALSSPTVAQSLRDGRTGGSDPIDTLTAQVILERALRRAEKQKDSGIELEFEYLLESVVESVDGDGVVTDTETAQYRRYPLEGHLYDELVLTDGQPLDDKEAREEQKQKTEFTEKARAHAARGERYDPEEMNMRFDHELMDRYDTKLEGSETVRGHVCWVLSFAPRDGQLPDTRRMDKARNRSTGQLWISKDDYGVVRVAFEMQEPFRYLWGLVATLRHATGQLDLERIEPGLWTPTTFDLEMDLRVFFKSIRRHIRQEWLEHIRLGTIP